MFEYFLINLKCVVETSIYIIEDLLFEVIELKPQTRQICSRGNFFVMVRWLRERFMKNDPVKEFNLVVIMMSIVSQIGYYYMFKPVCNFFFLIFEMRSSNWLHLYRCIFFEKSQYMYKFIDIEVYFRSGSFNYFSELQSYKCRTMTECKDLLHSNSR